jgi:hypothetical protein
VVLTQAKTGLSCVDDPAHPGKPVGCGAVGNTVATNNGGCLRAVRSLSRPPVQCCTSYQDKANPDQKPTGPCALVCPAKSTIQSVRFADYGTAVGNCGNFAADPKCSAANYTDAITRLAREQCLGKRSCTVDQKDKFVWGDPCPGNQKKRLTLSVRVPLFTPIPLDSPHFVFLLAWERLLKFRSISPPCLVFARGLCRQMALSPRGRCFVAVRHRPHRWLQEKQGAKPHHFEHRWLQEKQGAKPRHFEVIAVDRLLHRCSAALLQESLLPLQSKTSMFMALVKL